VAVHSRGRQSTARINAAAAGLPADEVFDLVVDVDPAEL